jgi:anti-anti-sigma factor
MTGPSPVEPFAVSLLFVGNRLDLRIGGTVDASTSPLLALSLAYVPDDAATQVTLDLGEVDVIDAAGARAIASIAARLQRQGNRLRVRRASVRMRDLLHLGSLDHLMDFVPGDRTTRTAPGGERVASANAVATQLVAARLGPQEHRFAAVDVALGLVTQLAQATVPGVDGVSVSLHRAGALTTVAATDDRIAQMDRDQYTTGEGPCLTAAREGRVVEVRDLAHETRWRDFVPRALMGGIASILSSPLTSSAGPVGALNMYSKTERAFGSDARALAELYAQQASNVLVGATDRPSDLDASARIQSALVTRNVIAQAQGILMARTGCTADESYVQLKLTARATKRSVRDMAEATVASATPAVASERHDGG